MPNVPDSSDLRTRKTAQETAQRVLALLGVVGKVHEPERTLYWIKLHEINRYFSPLEAAFILEDEPAHERLVAFSWRAEAVVSLVWAMGEFSKMPPLHVQFDLFESELARSALNDPRNFVSAARLRSAAEIDDMEGFLYHQHWRVRDAELVDIGKLLEPAPNDPPIDELDHDIVYQRRYALSWLVGWGDDWDNVPTDT